MIPEEGELSFDQRILAVDEDFRVVSREAIKAQLQCCVRGFFFFSNLEGEIFSKVSGIFHFSEFGLGESKQQRIFLLGFLQKFLEGIFLDFGFLKNSGER